MDDKKPDELELDRPPPPRAGQWSAPRQPVQAIKPQRPTGSWVLRIAVVAALAAGAYGGYYGYCRYKVSDKIHQFTQAYNQGLYQKLMHRTLKIRKDDVRAVVEEMARGAGVTLREGTFEAIIEPLTADNEGKLPSTAQFGAGLANQVAGKRQRSILVGFKGKFLARFGRAWEIFDAERYTYYPEHLLHPDELPQEDKSGLPPLRRPGEGEPALREGP